MPLPTWTRHPYLLFTVSSFGMGKEGQKSSGLLLACLLSVAWYDGTPKDWPAEPSSSQNVSLNWNLQFCIKIYVAGCSIMSYTVHLIDGAHPCTVLDIWDLQTCKTWNLAKMSFSLITLWSCFKQENRFFHPNLDHLQQNFKNRNLSFLA